MCVNVNMKTGLVFAQIPLCECFHVCVAVHML